MHIDAVSHSNVTKKGYNKIAVMPSEQLMVMNRVLRMTVSNDITLFYRYKTTYEDWHAVGIAYPAVVFLPMWAALIITTATTAKITNSRKDIMHLSFARFFAMSLITSRAFRIEN